MSEISGATADAPQAVRTKSSLPRRGWLAPLVIYAISRGVAGVYIAELAPQQHAFSPTGVHLEVPLPAGRAYLPSLTNWDGQWFWTVAVHGYPLELPGYAEGQVIQNAWAFYPVYPFTVRAVMEVTSFSFPLAATIVSTLMGAGAVLLLYRLLRPTAGELNALLAVSALCAYPAAPILQAAYSEATALFLLILSLLLLRTRRYGWLMATVLVLSLTRPIALPLALVIAWHWWSRWRKRAVDPFPARDRWTVAGVTVGTIASAGIWPAVAGIVTGVPKAYELTHAAWVVGPRADQATWPSWLVLAIKPTDLTPVVLLASILVAVAVLRPASRAWATEIRAWGLAYAAYVMAATQAISSVFRYALLLVVWWPFPLSQKWSQRPAIQALTVSTVLAIGFAAQFYWLAWFFLPIGAPAPNPFNMSCCYP